MTASVNKNNYFSELILVVTTPFPAPARWPGSWGCWKYFEFLVGWNETAMLIHLFLTQHSKCVKTHYLCWTSQNHQKWNRICSTNHKYSCGFWSVEAKQLWRHTYVFYPSLPIAYEIYVIIFNFCFTFWPLSRSPPDEMVCEAGGLQLLKTRK